MGGSGKRAFALAKMGLKFHFAQEFFPPESYFLNVNTRFSAHLQNNFFTSTIHIDTHYFLDLVSLGLENFVLLKSKKILPFVR